MMMSTEHGHTFSVNSPLQRMELEICSKIRSRAVSIDSTMVGSEEWEEIDVRQRQVDLATELTFSSDHTQTPPNTPMNADDLSDNSAWDLLNEKLSQLDVVPVLPTKCDSVIMELKRKFETALSIKEEEVQTLTDEKDRLNLLVYPDLKLKRKRGSCTLSCGSSCSDRLVAKPLPIQQASFTRPSGQLCMRKRSSDSGIFELRKSIEFVGQYQTQCDDDASELKKEHAATLESKDQEIAQIKVEIQRLQTRKLMKLPIRAVSYETSSLSQHKQRKSRRSSTGNTMKEVVKKNEWKAGDLVGYHSSVGYLIGTIICPKDETDVCDNCNYKFGFGDTTHICSHYGEKTALIHVTDTIGGELKDFKDDQCWVQVSRFQRVIDNSNPKCVSCDEQKDNDFKTVQAKLKAFRKKKQAEFEDNSERTNSVMKCMRFFRDHPESLEISSTESDVTMDCSKIESSESGMSMPYDVKASSGRKDGNSSIAAPADNQNGNFTVLH